MIFFQCDYAEGAHPRILERLSETNLEQSAGYGQDVYCESAKARIRKACGCPDVDVHFLAGGTQANIIIIASALRPHQGVISADTGHIACHETGAIEAAGHKVLALGNKDGMITAAQVKACIEAHLNSPTAEHEIQPGMVYISYPTESGTLYSKAELTKLSEICRQYSLPLFLDGARLGYGLTSPACDLTLEELTRLCDVFYIGGTKCGALFGEAVVITNESLKRDFRYFIKQRGALLAKGRLLGIQFDELFRDNLYFDICGEAVSKALKIRRAFERKGISMFGTSMTNQQFPILTKTQMDYLGNSYKYETWGAVDEEHVIVRFCTSWATTDENVATLVADIQQL